MAWLTCWPAVRTRKKKERAIRKRQLLGLQRGLKDFDSGAEAGLKHRDKVVEQVGRLKNGSSQAARLATITIPQVERPGRLEVEDRRDPRGADPGSHVTKEER